MGNTFKKFTHLDLCSGIGGFSLGLEATGGFETIGFAEIEPFCCAVLKKHWPHVPNFGFLESITNNEWHKKNEPVKLGKEDYGKLGGDSTGVDIITAGFP